MADDVDITLERQERDEAVLRQARAERMTYTADDSAQECVDCGHQLSQARRSAVPGTTRCASCAADHERRQAQYAAGIRLLADRLRML